jgi:hypothetical protein
MSRGGLAQKIHHLLTYNQKNVAWLQMKMLEWGIEKHFRKLNEEERQVVYSKLIELFGEKEPPARKRRQYRTKL